MNEEKIKELANKIGRELVMFEIDHQEVKRELMSLHATVGELIQEVEKG